MKNTKIVTRKVLVWVEACGRCGAEGQVPSIFEARASIHGRHLTDEERAQFDLVAASTSLQGNWTHVGALVLCPACTAQHVLFLSGASVPEVVPS